MSMTTVPASSTGAVWTEAMYDTYQKDNFNKGVWRPISSQVLDATSSSVVFQGFTASDFAILRLVLCARGTTAATSAGLTMTFNDSASGYSYRRLWGLGATATSDSSASASYLLGLGIPASTAPASQWGVQVSDIYWPGELEARSYSYWATYKKANSSGNVYVSYGGGSWSNTTSPINKITLSLLAGDFDIGSSFDLYGMGTI